MYNHEAKISLFIQIAMTREGSALLLSNNILNSIINCNFFNMRYDRRKPLGISYFFAHPYRSSMTDTVCFFYIDTDSAHKVERHERLLTSILVLVNALLMSSGGQGDNLQQFEFWVKKQDVLVNILKDDTTEPTLSSLHILHLTVSFLYQLSKQAFYFVDLEKNGLAEFDSLLMSLIPKYCIPTDWASVVKSTEMKEIDWPSTTVSGKHLY